MNEDKATRYHRLGRRAGMLSTLWTAVILLAVLFTDGSVVLREWAARIAGANPTLIVAVYVLILSLFFDVATLPFGFYRGFLLERRYGLSTETTGHWLKDHAKAVLIGLLFAEVGAVFVYFALRNWPRAWWAIAGAGYSGVAIALVNLAPVILLPLFFTFKRLEKATLRDRLTALASKAGTRIMGVYEWTLSDRTKKANAALTGMGNRGAFSVGTLLRTQRRDRSDSRARLAPRHNTSGRGPLRHGVDVRGSSPRTWAAGAVSFSICKGLQILQESRLCCGRRHVGLCVSRAERRVGLDERRADSYALKMTANPSAFITAMKRLGQQNLAEDSPSKLVQAFFYTHPPIKERLRAAQSWVQ